jgi:SagB-type dehydrogenase family enzyme
LTDLPAPSLSAELSLEEALASRRSVRDYDDEPLTTTEIGQLLWATQGITGEQGYRTAPSAGALYPLEIYLLTADGVFHYDPRQHRLTRTSETDARPALYQAALRQEPIVVAPADFVVTAVYGRTAQKYGEQRGNRYVHLEAGHAAQNLLLQATAMGLGAVPIGAFNDEEVQQALGLSAHYQPIYLIPVGHPGSPDR